LAEVESLFRLQREHWDQMRAHVDEIAPQEACGLVAGKNAYSVAVFPIHNLIESPVRYQMDPEQQIKAFIQMEEKGWDLAAIYHSHPSGPHKPSPTDVAENYYPDTIHLVWSRIDDSWDCKGFIISGRNVREVQIEIQDVSNSG
jgi:[CysO sulfur-carrier protein]-S-L-cysteine hydrolase